MSGLPPQYAGQYDVGFAQRFPIIGANIAAALVRGWAHPCRVAQVEVIQDLYGLDLEDGWRSRLEEHLLEDTDSETLYQNAMDGFEDDVEPNMQLGLAPMNLKDWCKPFNDSRVPPSCADPARSPSGLQRFGTRNNHPHIKPGAGAAAGMREDRFSRWRASVS
ncbi:hypothetical protein [uncultured Arthrobacter sp.]|uniref:hypothetical protein n=1 Tax=uncultured Arthrobacter sp. TaxID=114050 RepID=UPI0028D1FE3A|nr:hypothetical protein [uncultured Arthrobacter sp.]